MYAGLPDFSLHNRPKWRKIYQMATKLPNGHNIFQMPVMYSKWPYNIPILSISRPSKINPNFDFWFENKPSGNLVPMYVIDYKHSGHKMNE
jgi:hypothetical protein